MHMFKILCYRYLSSLGPLSGATWLILVRFGFQMGTKIHSQIIENVVHLLVVFWTSFGTMPGAILEVKLGSKRELKIG